MVIISGVPIFRIFTVLHLFCYKTGFYPLWNDIKQLHISPMKFCFDTSFTFPKQSQRSRSILQDGSRFLELFRMEKSLSKKYGNLQFEFSPVIPEMQLQTYPAAAEYEKVRSSNPLVPLL